MNLLDKLINRIPGSRLLISSLPGSASRTYVGSLRKPRDVNKRLVNLISKDTHLVFFYLCEVFSTYMYKYTFKCSADFLRLFITIANRFGPRSGPLGMILTQTVCK